MRHIAIWITLIGLLTACGGPPPAARPTAPVKPSGPPSWVEGEFPSEEAFFGHGEAPITDQGPKVAQEAALAGGVTNIELEMKLLVKALKDDYEEVVAVDPEAYDLYKMHDDIDQAAVAALQEAAVVDTWTDKSRSPAVMHVLVKLPVQTYYATLFASIPDDPRKRIKNYEHTFTRAVMESLRRY
ncbi:MAG: hypothetical protein CMH57_08155 [Myxococcales bacterium]|nr:hypothetical protein [Myxococcales bacterium]